MSLFTQFGLCDPIIKAITAMGYQEPTPIQAVAIPKTLEGVDLRASAQTGTGKTAAFLLPAIHQVVTQPREKKKGPSVLVLVPTRELAMQVAEEAKKFTKHLQHIQTVCIYGGVPYPIQRKALQKKYDILVATPGRLLDHMDQGRITLSDLKLFILDEADRMLDMGFIDDVERIARSMPKDRQTLLFSATIDKSILPISERLQKDPFEIRIEPKEGMRQPIDQVLYYVDNLSHKVELLEHLLNETEFNQTIVFTSTISQADELADLLRDKGHLSGSLHGDMNQRQRTRTIDQVRKGKIRVLIATDVAARGIDISTLTHVFNFDLPFQTENFVHRIGRTGRAGAKGVAISFATYREEALLNKIQKLTGVPMTCQTVSGLEPKAKKSKSKEGFRHERRGSFGKKRWDKKEKKGEGKKSFFFKKSRRNQGETAVR